KETDLSRVRGAFDISVTDPEQVVGEPGADEDRLERAEFLQSAVISVEGDPGSCETVIEVGERGSVAGRLRLKPVRTRTDFGLEVSFRGVPSLEPFARQARDAISPGDLVTIYYESGHVFSEGRIYRQDFRARPFPHFVFEDFAGTNVTKEKPAVRGDQAIHDSIGEDDSLFTWVVRHFADGWLLCDDGAGEVADFLHLADDGALTAIHVKGAASGSANRRIAVQPFQEVASQAVKNVRQLYNEVLVARLSPPRIERPGAWHDGQRVPSSEFVDGLSLRVASDRTTVMIVQPHLLQGPYVNARNAGEAGRPNRNSFSLALLDNLMHSTRRAITSHCDDLVVVGAR
uniref:hypothetical protein n=1 Tax=Amycolatopsis sacchari TaxID=115433 RepID=UPI003D70E115